MRDDAQNRRSQDPLDVVQGFDAGVEIFDEERETDADDQADNNPQNNIERLVRPDRAGSFFSPVQNDDTGTFRDGGVDCFLDDFQAEGFADLPLAGQIAFGDEVFAVLADGIALELHFFVELIIELLGGVDLDGEAEHDPPEVIGDLLLNFLQNGIVAHDLGMQRTVIFLGDGELLLGDIETFEQRSHLGVRSDDRDRLLKRHRIIGQSEKFGEQGGDAQVVSVRVGALKIEAPERFRFERRGGDFGVGIDVFNGQPFAQLFQFKLGGIDAIALGGQFFAQFFDAGLGPLALLVQAREAVLLGDFIGHVGGFLGIFAEDLDLDDAGVAELIEAQAIFQFLKGI